MKLSLKQYEMGEDIEKRTMMIVVMKLGLMNGH
jgi:hypothetical protein